MLISHTFDSGNIKVTQANDPADIRLNIRKDNQSDFYQWFHFRLSGVDGEDCRLTIENAGGAAYKEGWEDYNVCASYDRETLFRVPTGFDGETITWAITPESGQCVFRLFRPLLHGTPRGPHR